MEFEVYSIGICNASVCTSLPINEATERLNAAYPTGIASQWKPSTDKYFRSGECIGHQCPDHKNNKHFLFHC